MTVSPLAVAMLLLAVYGAVQYYEAIAVPFIGAGPAVVVGSAVIWAVYGALAILAVAALQRYARRPAWTIALGLARGGFVVLYFAATANEAIDTALENATGFDAGTWLAAPVVEESLKALGVVALVLVPVLRRIGPLDGLFYGVVVGAAFQVVENFTYTVEAAFGALPGQEWQLVWTTLVLRGVFGVFTHAVWTGIVGAAIGWVAALHGPSRVLRVLVAVAAFGFAIAVHGTSNYLVTNAAPGVNLIPDAIGLIVLVVVLLRLQRNEKRRLTEITREHDGWGVLDPGTVTSTERGRTGRQQERRRLRYAYAADQFGTEAPATRRAAERLH